MVSQVFMQTWKTIASKYSWRPWSRKNKAVYTDCRQFLWNPCNDPKLILNSFIFPNSVFKTYTDQLQFMQYCMTYNLQSLHAIRINEWSLVESLVQWIEIIQYKKLCSCSVLPSLACSPCFRLIVHCKKKCRNTYTKSSDLL